MIKIISKPAIQVLKKPLLTVELITELLLPVTVLAPLSLAIG